MTSESTKTLVMIRIMVFQTFLQAFQFIKSRAAFDDLLQQANDIQSELYCIVIVKELRLVYTFYQHNQVAGSEPKFKASSSALTI